MKTSALLLALAAVPLLGFGSCEPAASASPAGDEPDFEPPAAGPADTFDCLPVQPLVCGATVDGDTSDPNHGTTQAVDFYAGAVGSYAGPELSYRVDATASGSVEVAFVDPEPTLLNHDLFVLDATLGCTGEAALARGFNSLSFPVEAGHRYYVVVDGPDEAGGAFAASTECEDGAVLSDGVDEADPGVGRPDPFAAQPDTGEGLVNISADLQELLEFGEIFDGCDRWAEHPEDRHAKLLCGKYRFFYEPMGTDGIPQPRLDWMGGNFPDWAGDSFAGFGLVPDPYADEPRALGFGRAGSFGFADTQGMTCASCHFGELPDGRYAIGYPNHDYDYGTHMLSLMVGVQAGIPGFDASAQHPDAIAALQPMIDAFGADPWLTASLMWNLTSLLTEVGNIPEVPYEVQGQYASWRTGTMDFLIAPLSADDGVHTVSRISPLWGIADEPDFAAYGTDHAQLGWTGGTRSIADFARGFVHVGGGDLNDWPDEQLEPLAEFILSLRAPAPAVPPHPSDVAAGRAVFETSGCIDCHGGPRGGGLEIYSWEEIGTDDTLRTWGAPDADGELCCGLSDYDNSYDTGGVKAPRLVGAGTFGRFLHNGALDSLEQLFCLKARPAAEVPPFAARGHEFGCDSLSVQQREQLAAFLRAQ